jgi:hypothetical protein
MPLLRKGTSNAMALANRVNAKKSTGPATERGKSVSRDNAGRHWGRAEGMRDLMPALGENPRDFAAVLAGLCRALKPQDPFEEMLVGDMADIHWRLRRMIRGETAVRARDRRQQQANDEEREASMAAGRLHELEPALAGTVGIVGLHDSPPKFVRVIEVLKAIGEMVQLEGFPGEGTAFLKTLYGRHPGSRGSVLLEVYGRFHEHEHEREKGFHEHEKDVPGETSAADRAAFQQLIDAEIAWFEERAARDRQARAEMEAPRIEAALANSRRDSAAAMLYQERLERRFDRKWKLLMQYRRSQGAREGRERIAGG